jgi:hypothetical protein
MKRLQTLALSLVVCALLTPAAFAGVKTKYISFDKDVKVGDTLVKKGNYKVRFDEESNELTILDGKKVVAKTTARLEAQKSTSRYDAKYKTISDAEGNVTLLSIHLDGKSAIIGADKTAGTPASTVQKP